MVGEVRDLETAEMAIHAALTSHLVISTLHTNDAPSAITRLLELGVVPYLIKATVLAIMAQRLVRKLCSLCKTPIEVSADGWETLTAPWKVKMPARINGPVGCLAVSAVARWVIPAAKGSTNCCHCPTVSKANIDEKAEIGKLRRAGMAEGMRTLRLSGARKVAAGLTTIDEVLRVAPFSGAE